MAMTREEAILYLQPIADSAHMKRYSEALGVAIAALRERETVTNRNGFNCTESNTDQRSSNTDNALTNADHYRSMTDEELAVEIMCPYHIEPEMCNRTDTCVACCLEWLKQPYREEV